MHRLSAWSDHLQANRVLLEANSSASELSDIDCELGLATLKLSVHHCKLTAPASELSEIDCELSPTTFKLAVCDCKLTAPASELSKMHRQSAWSDHLQANRVPP